MSNEVFDRPLTQMQVAEVAYAALAALRRVSANRLKEWSMLHDRERIGFVSAGPVFFGEASDRDLALVSAIADALADY